MPVYDFVCTKCQRTRNDVFRWIRDLDKPEVCECNYRMLRVPSLPHSDLNAFHKPIELFSCAVNSVEEAIELREKCPDADVNVDINHPDFGLPIARTRKAKMQVLAASGMRERN